MMSLDFFIVHHLTNDIIYNQSLHQYPVLCQKIPNRYFSLNTDPFEKKNIYKKFPNLVLSLLKRLREYDIHSIPFYYPDKETGQNLLHKYLQPSELSITFQRRILIIIKGTGDHGSSSQIIGQLMMYFILRICVNKIQLF